MVIDVIKLIHSGKTQIDFSFDYSSKAEILTYGAVIDGPINVTGTLELHEGEVYVDGEISCNIVGKCARCLEDAKYSFATSFSVKYVRSNPNDEDNEYLYKSGKVDLSQAVDEHMLLNVPTIIYCKEDCKGLCPICGCNLNNNDCDCKY